MVCKNSLKKVLSFALAFLLGLVAAAILQNKNIAPKTQEKVKSINKIIYREQESGFSGNDGRGSSGLSDREKKLPPFYIPKSLENFSSPLKIISKPRAYYTDLARQNYVQGTIRLRVVFLADGTVGNITPVNNLPDGLTEQAIIAAKQIKFEPMIKNGRATTVIKKVQYNFAIY